MTLEDTDPYRDCHQWPAAPRLPDSEFARWQGLFGEAWQQIDRNHGSFAAGLAAGLTTLMPLAGLPGGRDAGTASRHAPGAVALALPDDPVALALLLICAFQRVKLNAVLDLYDLYDPADDRMFPAPWGDGKQHLEGLFQDAYAHLAGTDFWRVRQQLASGRSARVAGQRSAQWRAGEPRSHPTLTGSGSLTPLGMKFVEIMSHAAGHR